MPIAAEYEGLNAALPELDALTEKVARVHGPATPSLLEVREQYLSLALALQSLAGRRDEAAATLQAARCLTRLRNLTQSYLAPPNACRSYRAMLAGLAALDLGATPVLRRLTQLEEPCVFVGATSSEPSSGCAGRH